MKKARDPLYGRHRFPAEVIGYAVFLYFRFPLSLRMVEDMLATLGIIVSHETVRRWAMKFGRDFANKIRRPTPQLGDKWHLDEVVITINGKKHWLWRAVDQDGFVLDALIQSCRDKRAAERLCAYSPQAGPCSSCSGHRQARILQRGAQGHEHEIRTPPARGPQQSGGKLSPANKATRAL